MRPSGRAEHELREIVFELSASKYAEGSCLVSFGDTRVLCTASVEERVPPFRRHTGLGWVTAEYGMLPRSTETRNDREAARGKQSGRTQEIQRLIGRSLRAVVDEQVLGERQIRLDCDVLQADGGTRTASITGAYLALHVACVSLLRENRIKRFPLKAQVAAISCGLYQGTPVIDLDYGEDMNAIVDGNFVMTSQGEIIEIQASGEQRAFTAEEFQALLELAQEGVRQLVDLQKQVLEEAGVWL